MYEDVLLERGASLERIELDEGDELPSRRDFDAVIAMGGPMSVNDDAELPWLANEKRFVGQVVRAGTPFWGVCLGVQLLAASLGARVYPGPEPEVGLLPVELTAEGRDDAVFADLADGLVTLQWHGDTFDLPDGAVRLAGSPAYPNQAFRWGAAYGVQFHLEVTPAMAREWAHVREYAASLEQTLGPDKAASFLGEHRGPGRRDACPRPGFVRALARPRRHFRARSYVTYVSPSPASRETSRHCDQSTPGRRVSLRLGVHERELEPVRERQRLLVDLHRRRRRTPRRRSRPASCSAPVTSRARITSSASADQSGRRVTTTVVRPGNGRPIDSYVRRPITSTWPMVSALKRRRSSGRCHGSPPSTPITPLRATAATMVTVTTRQTAIGALIAGCGS